MFNARKFNQTVILYFVTVILGLALASLTSCGRVEAQPDVYEQMAMEAEKDSYKAQPEAIQAQCAAKTKTGTQCSRKAAEGQTYCWQHGGATKAEQAGTKIQGSDTCGATTKAGTACKNRTKDGGKCHLHK